jgi:hypothetical protein
MLHHICRYINLIQLKVVPQKFIFRVKTTVLCGFWAVFEGIWGASVKVREKHDGWNLLRKIF